MALYLALSEVLAHVKSSTGQDERWCQEEILRRLKWGELIAQVERGYRAWERPDGSPGKIIHDWFSPKVPREFWLECSVDWGENKATRRTTVLESNGIPRRSGGGPAIDCAEGLHVMRMFVDRLWPEAANISALAEVVALDSETEGPATCDVTPVQPSRGRPKGSGLHKADEPFVQVMRQMVESGKVTGVTDAARRLAEFAAGGGTIESKAERLCDRYRRMYGPET